MGLQTAVDRTVHGSVEILPRCHVTEGRFAKRPAPLGWQLDRNEAAWWTIVGAAGYQIGPKDLRVFCSVTTTALIV